MQTSTASAVPFELQKLLDAVSSLTQVAQQKTPDGRPTIANQVEQAAQQTLQQPAPQEGLPGMLPGDPFQQQMMETLKAKAQAQAEAQAKMMQMMAQGGGGGEQRPPMMAAEGGLMSLPADNMARLAYANGGVVGFAGTDEFGSFVPDPEAAAMDELRVENIRLRRAAEKAEEQAKFLEEAGAKQAPEARARAEQAKRAALMPAPEATQEAKPKPKSRPQASAPAPAPISAPAPAPSAPSGVIDFAKVMPELMGLIKSGIEKEGTYDKPLPQTEEEARYIREHEAETARRRQDIDARRQRYLDLEKMREEAGKVSGLDRLAAYLSRAGGARSLFAGLGQAAQAQAGIDAASRKEAQAAIDRRMQYFESLDRERDAINDRNEALRFGQMERARAAQEKIRQIQLERNRLGVTTAAQMYGPTLQAAQSVENTQRELESREKMNRDRVAATLAAARMRGMKPPPGMGIADIQKLNEMVNNEFRTLGNDARRIIGKMPNGAQLLRDIDNKNIDPQSETGRAKIAPILTQAMNLYKQELLGQTKFGAQPMAYSAARSALGLSSDDQEDED